MYYDAPLFFNTLQNRANEAGSNQVHFISYLQNLEDAGPPRPQSSPGIHI